MKNRLLKKRKDFSKQFIFNLEIYLHLPDVGTTLVQYFFFFFQSCSIQFKLIFCLLEGLGLEY